MSEVFDSIAGTGVISTLENRFREHAGTRFAVAVCNGTAAIHAALISVGVRRGDEVIVPAFTWGGSITGVLQIGAVPVFADIDATLTLDADDVEAKVTSRTKAVILVHLFGYPGHCSALQDICSSAGITLIEDCAQAFGATQNGRSVGSFGIGCFSFSAGKPLSVADGGILTTDDPSVYESVLYHTQHPLRQLKDIHSPGSVNQFALNYRMSPYTAERVLRSFHRALEQTRQRAAMIGRINDELATSFASIRPIRVRDGDQPTWYRYSPAVDRDGFDRDYQEIRAYLDKAGFIAEKGYVPIPLHRDPALAGYLSVRKWSSAKKQHLPFTEHACETRIGIALREPGF